MYFADGMLYDGTKNMKENIKVKALPCSVHCNRKSVMQNSPQ